VSTPRSASKGEARAAATAVLAERLRERSAARAARSVDEDLQSSTSGLASVTALAGPLASVTSPTEKTSLQPASAPEPAEPSTPSPERATGSPVDEIVVGDVAPTTGLAAPTPVRRTAKSRTPPPKPVAGPDGRLELRERVTKMTLELPIPLVDALARWERDETRTTGQRVYRERLIDCALRLLPEDIDQLVTLARGLPEPLRHADTEQVGTRVLESIATRLKNLRPELRVIRVRDVYLRHIYAAAIYQYLISVGVEVDLLEL